MESPARKLQKQKDYQRHKMFRKMARKRKAKAEQEQKVAEKALKRKLKLPKYDKGEDDDTSNPKSNNATNKRRIVDYGGGSLYSYPEVFDKNLPYEVSIPEVVVTARSKYNPYSWRSVVPFEYSRNANYFDIPNPIQEIRERAYRTINPLSDYNISKNFKAFIDGQPLDWEDVYTHEDGSQWVEFEDASANIGIVDDMWARYLQIPENKRRQFNQRLEESQYRPSMGDEPGVVYYKFPLTDQDKENLIEETNELPLNSNKVSNIFWKYNLADHTVGKGIDELGEFRSIYDKFDLNPFGGKYQGTRIPLLEGFGDVSLGIGKPVDIYNRLYLDDYYGVFGKDRGYSYLPEVQIWGERQKSSYDSGKSGIHIKPSKRGTFTAAAKRRGMGVQEFARKVLSAPKGKYSSAMRKKANFARVFGGRNY